LNRAAKIGILTFALLLLARKKGYAVKFKDGVNLELQPEMARALPLIEKAHDNVNVGRGAVITSAKDGTHKNGSKHYVGLAVDVRANDLPIAKARALTAEIKRLLGSRFDVILEDADSIVEPNDHIHVEYDPK
jgi:hypothetical protein